MLIRNAEVFDEKAGFVPRDICTDNNVISADSTDGEVIDAKGLYAIPALCDIHMHGCAGHDVCDESPQGLEDMCRFELKNGVTRVLPTTMAIPHDAMLRVLGTIPKNTDYGILGFNIEGSYISPQRACAHDSSNIFLFDNDDFDRLNSASDNRIRLVTVAPERDGAIDFIRHAVKRGIRVSLGHTNADYETAMAAFDAGASHLTHMFNAMPAVLHRAPSVIAAAFDSGAMVELITDGIHVLPPVVRMAFAAFGDDRIILVSDSTRAAGMPDGKYTLGGLPVFKRGKMVCASNGQLAGSASTLFDCMRRAVTDMGIPLASAVKCACVNPLKALGLWDNGSSALACGSSADIVLLDSALEINAVISGGKRIV